MPNHIIPLKRIETGDRITGGSRFPGRPGTTRRGQASRLGPKLDRAFSDILDRADFDVAADPQALAPERVLVFEIIGQVANFAATARRVGLEWLAERLALLEGVEAYATPDEDDDRDEDDDETAADPDLAGDPEPARPTAGRFYMAAPTRAAFEKLRDLWDRYKSGAKHPDNFSDWWRLFDRLHDLRPWVPQDRVPDATSRYIEVELARDPERELTVEIEVWFYDDGDFRRSQAKRIEIEIEDLGGEVLDTAEIEAIQYNAILARLPAAELESLANRHGPLAASQPIMTIRPQSMFRAPTFEETPLQSPEAAPPRERDARPSYAALLDGFPVQNHVLLRNRLDIIELDVDEDSAPLARRVHGTAMSSIILHGDLEKQEPPISRVLKVVPILAPDEDGFEAPPRDRLILKTIFEAIEHLKEGREDEEPSERTRIISREVKRFFRGDDCFCFVLLTPTTRMFFRNHADHEANRQEAIELLDDIQARLTPRSYDSMHADIRRLRQEARKRNFSLSLLENILMFTVANAAVSYNVGSVLGAAFVGWFPDRDDMTTYAGSAWAGLAHANFHGLWTWKKKTQPPNVGMVDHRVRGTNDIYDPLIRAPDFLAATFSRFRLEDNRLIAPDGMTRAGKRRYFQIIREWAADNPNLWVGRLFRDDDQNVRSASVSITRSKSFSERLKGRLR